MLSILNNKSNNHAILEVFSKSSSNNQTKDFYKVCGMINKVILNLSILNESILLSLDVEGDKNEKQRETKLDIKNELAIPLQEKKDQKDIKLPKAFQNMLQMKETDKKEEIKNFLQNPNALKNDKKIVNFSNKGTEKIEVCIDKENIEENEEQASTDSRSTNSEIFSEQIDLLSDEISVTSDPNNKFKKNHFKTNLKAPDHEFDGCFQCYKVRQPKEFTPKEKKISFIDFQKKLQTAIENGSKLTYYNVCITASVVLDLYLFKLRSKFSEYCTFEGFDINNDAVRNEKKLKKLFQNVNLNTKKSFYISFENTSCSEVLNKFKNKSNGSKFKILFYRKTDSFNFICGIISKNGVQCLKELISIVQETNYEEKNIFIRLHSNPGVLFKTYFNNFCNISDPYTFDELNTLGECSKLLLESYNLISK